MTQRTANLMLGFFYELYVVLKLHRRLKYKLIYISFKFLKCKMKEQEIREKCCKSTNCYEEL